MHAGLETQVQKSCTSSESKIQVKKTKCPNGKLETDLESKTQAQNTTCKGNVETSTNVV